MYLLLLPIFFDGGADICLMRGSSVLPIRMWQAKRTWNDGTDSGFAQKLFVCHMYFFDNLEQFRSWYCFLEI